MYRRSDDGSFNSWDVQSVITVGSSAVATNVTSAKILGIHTDGEIYFNFSASSSASVSTANDLKLAAGLTFINVPKFSGQGVSQYHASPESRQF